MSFSLTVSNTVDRRVYSSSDVHVFTETVLIIELAVSLLFVRYKMPKQVVVCITAAALVLLPTIFEMEGLCAEIPKSHITCNAGTISAGTTAFVTCNFHKDMNTDKRPISVVRYPKGTPVNDPGTDVLLCQWQDRKQDYKCVPEKGFSIDGKINDHLRLKLPADTSNFTGLYSCFIMHAQDIVPNACALHVKDVVVVSTPRENNDTYFRQDKGKISLLWLIVLPFLFIGVVGAVIFYRCRLARNQMSNTPTRPSLEQIPFIGAISNGNDVTYFEFLREALKRVMDLVDQELTASHKGDTCLTCVASVQALPTKSASGAFLVVEFTRTTLKIHLVRLQDSKSGSLSKIYDVTERGQDEEFQLFDFIANNVHDFMTEQKLFSKKFRLVFMLSFACEYDADFSNARITKWARGFRFDGVVGRNLKELLQEALDRKNQKQIDSQRSQDQTKTTRKIQMATIRVVVVTNDTVGLLMSEAYKDPRCKIALCLIDGLTASYLQPCDNQATANGNIQNRTEVATTHLGALEENDCVAKLNTEYDRRLDKSTLYSEEHTLEKITSVLHLGEMVRLKLVQQMEKGQIFANCPRLSSKLGDESSISANDVSLIESDTNKYLTTKHLLKKLEMDHYTDEDCKAVRSVCKAVTKRAADLAAAGLATLINHLDDPDITVAIEGRLQEYYPGFLNQMEERTRELVKPHLQFQIVRSQEGSSTGAARLAAAVFPSFPKMAPNIVTSGH